MYTTVVLLIQGLSLWHDLTIQEHCQNLCMQTLKVDTMWFDGGI